MSGSERYKRMIEGSRDGFWVLDPEGMLLEVNQAYADMSGYTVEELVKMHVTQLDALDDEKTAKARIDKLLVRSHDRFETQHRRKDGRLLSLTFH